MGQASVSPKTSQNQPEHLPRMLSTGTRVPWTTPPHLASSIDVLSIGGRKRMARFSFFQEGVCSGEERVYLELLCRARTRSGCAHISLGNAVLMSMMGICSITCLLRSEGVQRARRSRACRRGSRPNPLSRQCALLVEKPFPRRSER